MEEKYLFVIDVLKPGMKTACAILDVNKMQERSCESVLPKIILSLLFQQDCIKKSLPSVPGIGIILLK